MFPRYFPRRLALVVLPALLASATTRAEEPGTWPLAQLFSEVPEFRWEDRDSPIHSLLYEGEPFGDRPTEVFAFYASPGTLGLAEEGERFPGMVLIHGGGGTAFSDWVWMWAQRGYAAIAMDLSGHRPPAPQFDDEGEKIPDHGHPRDERVRLANGGPDQGHAEKFHSIGKPRSHHWPYHAVASVLRAHTLLRSFDEVDPERTAVTGISWGGYTTCLVASLDDRFSAAVPVYGCGFLHEGESVQKPSIDSLGDLRDAWVGAYDPSSHLARCRIPLFWVNGTHDRHYVLDSYAKSYALAGGTNTFRIQPRMGHSHPAGWEPAEIGIYVDSLLKGGVPLPSVERLEREGGRVSVAYRSKTEVVGAELHYTTQSGPRSEREWQSLPAKVLEEKVVADGLPTEANTWLLVLTDERGALVTSEVGLR